LKKQSRRLKILLKHMALKDRPVFRPERTHPLILKSGVQLSAEGVRDEGNFDA
jgi:hypothetical protein